MSRARDWTHPDTGRVFWFDAYDNEATVEQIELLAEMEAVDIDDLLDERLSTKGVLYRLNENSKLIPHDVIARKRARAGAQNKPQTCRFHEDPTECEGLITKHHFVPKWLMLELPDYEKYAPRSRSTVPACVGIHRFLHRREGGASKSIVPVLTDGEKNLADRMIRSLKDERPAL